MKNNKFLFILLVFLNTSIVFGQNWNKKYLSNGNEFGNSIIEINNSIYINITNDATCKLINTDLSGNLIAQIKFDNLFRTSTLLKSSDNNIIVIGNDILNNGIVVLKLDLNFNTIWAFRSSFAGYNFAECGIVNTNGDITICGYSSSDPNSTANRNALIIRLNNNGQTIWTRVFNNSGTDYFSGICEGTNGEMLLTGAFQGGAGLMDLAIYKIDSSGNALYLKLYGGGQNDGGYSVDFFNNHFYISGNTWSNGAGQQDLLLMKFTSDMNFVWAKTYGGELIEPGLYITHSNTGNLILLGQTTSTNGKGRDICLLEINESGTNLKAKNIGGFGDEAIAFGYKVLLVLNDSYYVVCGSNSNSSDYDAMLYHTDLNTNDDCCRTIEVLNFITNDANLNLTNTTFNVSNNINSNTFNIQKSNLILSVYNLCNIVKSFSVDLLYENVNVCTNIPIQFQSMTNGINLNFKWDFGDVNSGNNNQSELENPTHLFTNAGNYLITLIASDGCSNDTDTITINILEGLQVNTSIVVPKLVYCIGEEVSFQAITNDLGATHFWNFGDTSAGNENSASVINPTHTFNNSGLYKVVLNAYNDCSIDSTEIDIRILSNSTPDFIYNIDTCLGTLQLLNIENSDINTFIWLNDNTIISEDRNTSFQLNNEGVYKIKLIQNPNSNCADTTEKEINYSKIDNSYLLLIPEIFSPNNDGKNDEFTIQGNVKCNLSNMTIYNRWGSKLYSSNSSFTWDGKHNNEFVSEGTYIVFLEYSGILITRAFYLQR